jgi:hypothetical protein
MAKDIKINSDGTLPIVGGDLVIISDADEVDQALRITLKMFFGEWFLNNQEGIRYFEEIFIKNYNLNRIEQLLRQAILGVEHVLSIKEYSQERVTERVNDVLKERLEVEFTVITEFGESVINEVIP